jgi:hypothetical protein
MGRVLMTVLVDLLKNVQHEPVSDQIVSPRQVFYWEHLCLTNMNIILVTEEQYKGKEELLLGRFSIAGPVSVTQKLYPFLPVKNGVLLAKMCCASSVCSTQHDVWLER